jgi:hypothetical protein
VSGHDVIAFANSLSSKLATRSRHVCALLGAGTSKACGLPDVATLEKHVAGRLEGEDRETFERLLDGRNLEQVLSRLRRITVLVEGDDSVDGLSGADSARLDASICRLIVEGLRVEDAALGPVLSFAAWSARADYGHPLEIFTVNYDLLLETALEQLGVPYFDGFVGVLRGRFRTDLVEAGPSDGEPWLPRFLARLWKLHGSVNWAWETCAGAEVVRLGTAVDAGTPAAIYPSDTKYEESRRVPFLVLQDRLRRALNQPETLMLVSGYSWADDHLNELLFNAATRRPRSEIVAFCYSEIPSVLADRALYTPNLQAVTGTEAILGGVRAAWMEPEDDVPSDLWAEDKMALCDFAQLASFLARSSSPHDVLESRLSDLLAQAEDRG